MLITSFRSSMLDFYKNDFATYKLEDDILVIIYHDNVIVDLEAAVQIVEDRLLIQQGQHLPVLCDIRGIKEINKSARNYLAFEGSVLIKAVAIIVEPPVSESLSKFYLRTTKPPIPNQSFYSHEEAKVFLRSL